MNEDLHWIACRTLLPVVTSLGLAIGHMMPISELIPSADVHELCVKCISNIVRSVTGAKDPGVAMWDLFVEVLIT